MCLFLKFYQKIHVHCLLSLCKKIKSKIELQRWKFRDLNLYFMTILTAFLKRRLLKIAKSPVLSTGGNDNSKSRYGYDLKFVMAFLDVYLYVVANGFSFNQIKK